jgi:hypothetical protein
MENPDIQVSNRNDDGTFRKGFSGNPAGRTPGKTMKEYQAQKFREMTDEEKEQWLKDNNVSADLKWRMSEGNPSTDVTSAGEKIIIPIYGNKSVSGHDSNQKDIQPEQENKGD